MLSDDQLSQFTQQVRAFTQQCEPININQVFGSSASLRRQFFKLVPMAQTILYTVMDRGSEQIYKGRYNEGKHVALHLIESMATQNAEAFGYLKAILETQANLPKDKQISIEERVPFIEVPTLWHNSSTKYYIPKLDQVLKMNEAIKGASDFHYTTASQADIESVLNSEFPGKKYVAIMYSHPTQSGTHVSLLLGQVQEGKILQDNLLSIDGFDSEGWCQMSESKYKQRIILSGKENEDHQDLQLPSFSDINCPVYARNYAKAVMGVDRKIIDAAFQEAIPLQKNQVKMHELTTQASISALMQHMTKRMEQYYNQDGSLKSQKEKDEYHLKLRLGILKLYFEECNAEANPSVQQDIKHDVPTMDVKHNPYISEKKIKENTECISNNVYIGAYINSGLAGLFLGGAVGDITYLILINTGSIPPLSAAIYSTSIMTPECILASCILVPAIIISAIAVSGMHYSTSISQ